MISRSDTLRVTKVASRVLSDSAARHRIDEGYTRVDPIAIAEQADVMVLARPMETLLGAFVEEGSPGILLNSDRPIGMLHMTCAHELGHYFLGHGTTADEHLDYKTDAAPFEQEANQFAYALITPNWLLPKVMKPRKWTLSSLRNGHVVYQLSLRLGLSYTATIWTLSRMEYIDLATRTHLLRIQPAALKNELLPKGSAEEGDRDIWRLGPEDRGSVLEPRPTDRLVVDLPSHASAGYLWTVSEAAELGFTLEPITVESVKEAPSPDQIVAGSRPSLERDDKCAVHHGRYELVLDRKSATSPVPKAFELAEVRPWEGSAAPSIDVLPLQAQMEVPHEGLSVGSKSQFLDRMQQS